MSEIGAIPVDTGSDRWPKLPLDPIQLKEWMLTRTAVLVNQQAFADVWLRMMVDKDRELAWFTDNCPIAATNDQFVFFNPKTFFKYKLLHRVFISCHEICHAIFNHCGKMSAFRKAGYVIYPDGLRLPYDNDIIQVSTDGLINDLLKNGRVGEMPPDAIHGIAGITYMDDIASAYRKLFEKLHGKGKQGAKNYENKKKSGNSKSNSLGKGFDQHLEPGQGTGKTPDQAASDRNSQAWDNALSAALASAKAQGKLHAVLDRGLSRLLEPTIQWQDELDFTTANRLGLNTSSWTILDNELMLRGIGSPGKTKYGCGTVVFATDSSGSINQNTLDMFNTQGVGLMEQARPRTLVYIQCDAKVHECVELDGPDDLMRKLIGGGGTDFRPVFDRIEEDGIEPDVLIYLTDLEGTFPKEAPPYPVIWCTVKDHPVPFGDRIMIPEQIE